VAHAAPEGAEPVAPHSSDGVDRRRHRNTKRAAQQGHLEWFNTGMGDYGANHRLVDGLIERAGRLSIDEAADIYHARATRYCSTERRIIELSPPRGVLPLGRNGCLHTRRRDVRLQLHGARRYLRRRDRGSWLARLSPMQPVPWSSRTS